MVAGNHLIAFAAITDTENAKRFYADVLGLQLVADEPWALVLDAAGTMLRLQKVQEVIPPQGTVLGWRVSDIRSDMKTLESRGVSFNRYEGLPQDTAGVWTTPDGAQIAWFNDPDGNTLSLTQF